MPDFPQTSDSLIARVRDPDNQCAWVEFEEIYRPVIYRIARARGMQHVDAEDLTQQVLMSVARAIGEYEQREGGPRFRNWLSRITRNAILKAIARSAEDQPVGGSDFMNVVSGLPTHDAATEQLIEVEYRRELYLRAATMVRGTVQEHTWLAFELTVLHERSIEDVASHLGLSSGSVYAARSRIMKKLRDAVKDMVDIDSETAHS